ncbi:MAG: hypothetical protein N2504_03710 [candidate division WOR-3 bacterium]|nr:hypothetical protein [candidate division WOR-3 bacterium]MCX7947674.1 hypothetical protein [candidate division WOR-3 bacterium]MDW8150551.1 hypothetical protein [candidate division WOR-3 bacterium]
MKEFRIVFFILTVSCSDAGLPGSPKVSRLEAVSHGDSLKIYWNSIEGADQYRVYVNNSIVYEGKDTNITLFYVDSLKIEAIGLNDKVNSQFYINNKFYEDSILVIPQIEALGFIFPKFYIYSIKDSSKFQQFTIFFSQDSSKIGKEEFNKDSLRIFSSSLYFNKATRHKVDIYNNSKVFPFPSKDSVKLDFKKPYVLWYSPDSMGWNNVNNYFIKFIADSLIYEVDSLNDTTYRIKVKYKVRTIPGLRWF